MIIRSVVLTLTIVRLLMIDGLDTEPHGSKNIRITNSTRRILHGKKADVLNFRFMVKIKSIGRCAGSIISNNWVLTATHCIHDVLCTNIEIYPVIWGGREKVNPSRCYTHEEYSKLRYEHDIGLMKFAKDLLLDLRASALDLPPPGKRYPPGTPAVIIGWGKTERNDYSEELLTGQVFLASRDTCAAKHWNNYPECKSSPVCRAIDLPLRMVCAIAESATPPGICYGDSGGPLIAGDNAIGISTILISSDKNCEIGAPSAFLSVVDYLPWIYERVNPSTDTNSFDVGPENSSP